MNRIKNKLRSRTGASITFALLLFLVCVVLCSVILSAATASSGRMAGLARTDQRYYAVTSACEMMRDMVGGEANAVTIVAETDTTSTTKYEDGTVDEESATEPTTIKKYKVQITTAEGTVTEEFTEEKFKEGTTVLNNTDDAINAILMNAAIKIYKTGNSLSDNDSWPKSFTIVSDTALKTALLENPETDQDPLAVTVLAELGSGKLTLKVCNTSTKTFGDRFTQIMVFSMHETTGGLPQEETMTSEGPTITEDGKVTYQVTTTTKTYETTTYSWMLDSIETHVEQASGT